MILYKKPLIVMVLSLGLTGCSTFNDKYDCPMKDGVSCVSMKNTDDAISSTMYNAEKLYSDKGHLTDYQTVSKQGQKSSSLVAKIWIAPYEDEASNYHDDSYIYTVVSKEKWIDTPIKP